MGSVRSFSKSFITASQVFIIFWKDGADNPDDCGAVGGGAVGGGVRVVGDGGVRVVGDGDEDDEDEADDEVEVEAVGEVSLALAACSEGPQPDDNSLVTRP